MNRWLWESPLRTKGVIQEPLVHTQTCAGRLGLRVPLARGGTESRDFTSNSSCDFVHRESIGEVTVDCRVLSVGHVKADAALCMFDVYLLVWLHQVFVWHAEL